MSRVEEAMRRATTMPRLAGASVPPTERAAERVDGSVLQLYAPEERSLPPTTASGQQLDVSRPENAAEVVIAPQVDPAFRGKLVPDGGVSPVSIEQYRRLAATMHHIQAEQGLRRLMVSSASPREGKTLTVVNLALTLSESYGRRVLLIDADLRRPSVHRVFGIANRGGLSQAIQSDSMELRTLRVS